MKLKDQLLALAEKSPASVDNVDKWVSLFTEEGLVQDPVGSPAHMGMINLKKFHSAFIAPFQVRFNVLEDFVDEECSRVVRIVDIHVRFRDLNLKYGQIQPAHLYYDLDLEKSKVKRMQAHWQVQSARPMGKTIIEKLLIDYLLYIIHY